MGENVLTVTNRTPHLAGSPWTAPTATYEALTTQHADATPATIGQPA